MISFRRQLVNLHLQMHSKQTWGSMLILSLLPLQLILGNSACFGLKNSTVMSHQDEVDLYMFPSEVLKLNAALASLSLPVEPNFEPNFGNFLY